LDIHLRRGAFMSYQERVKELADLIKRCSRVYALTGVGMSTESGIPDFRSLGPGFLAKMDPERALSLIDLYKNPAGFYDKFLNFWYCFSDALPNPGHLALVRMEKMGYLQGVITQNIDGLHKAAGSKKVWEVHGHLRTGYCIKCNSSFSLPEIIKEVEQGKNPPVCDTCHGIIRPSVVLFEDLMSPDFFAARSEIKGADLLIVVGSGLRVQPAASLPSLVNQVAIIGRHPTAWDDKAVVVINHSISNTLVDLVNCLTE